MRPLRPSAAFFDLDGCLLDSQAAITACINAALRSAGLPARAPAELRWCVGPPLRDSFARLLAEAGADPRRAPDLVDGYRAAYPEAARRTTRVVPGVADLLRRLHGEAPVAVVTSKPPPFAAPLLEAAGLTPFLAGLYAPGLDALAEAKTVTLRRALAATAAADRARTVMVGDRHHDIDAGRACGTATVGVTWGAGSRQELEDAGADVVVDTPDALAALLCP